MGLQSVDNLETSVPDTYLENQKKSIASYVIGAKDGHGNTVTKVYASGDEYVIYEIADTASIESLRVKIHTKIEDNRVPIQNFQKVKDSFDRLKSIMYKTGVDQSYKHRVAAALSRAILGDIDEANILFGKIEADAHEEYAHKVYGRLCYLFGAFLLTVIFGSLALALYINRDAAWLIKNNEILMIFYVMTFGSLGGFLSVSFKAKDVIAQRAISYWMYGIYGAERLVISLIAGIATYLLIKSGIIFTSFSDGHAGIYFLLAMCFVSGFSETLIPSYMGKLEKSS